MAKKVRNLPANAGDPGSIPGLGRSPGEGNGYPLQYSCRENSMDRGAWRATVLGLQRIRHYQATNIFTFIEGLLRQLPRFTVNGEVDFGGGAD